MRRKIFTILVAIPLVFLPSAGRSDHWDCGGFGAGLAFGFLIPIFTIAAIEAATAPHCYYYDPGPPRYLPPPDPPPPVAAAPAPERSVRAASPERGVGEVSTARPADPARSEAERLLRQGEFFKASEAYRALAIERPADREVALRFAEALLGVGSYRYAEHSLRRAIRAGISRDEIRAIGPGARLAERRTALEKRLPLDAAGSGRLLAAYAALAAGDPSAAEVQILALEKASPGDSEAHLLAEAIAASLEARRATQEGDRIAGSAPPAGSGRQVRVRINPLVELKK